MSIPAFNYKELYIASEIPGFSGAPPTPVYSFPAPPRDAVIALYKRAPLWQITTLEQKAFCPGLNPDNIARAFVFDAISLPTGCNGGKDMFNIEWEYIAKVGGSMVRPGNPYLKSANEWHDKLIWPDIDSWDWETASRVNTQYLSTDKFVSCIIINGWYERLISFMDFEGAVVAMVDEDQTTAVKLLFDKLSDFYIMLINKYLSFFPQIDGFSIHDDWGGQQDTFFSPAVAAEMIVPFMKKVTDHLHCAGKFCELHSCGQLMKQIPNIIAAGWDSWSGQPINDLHRIYELYGDELIIGVGINQDNLTSLTEEEQRSLARDYADKYCNPKKPSVFNFYSGLSLTNAFREELYIRSREHYSNSEER